MDKLKKMGYVDARSNLIFLTEKGQQLKPLFQEISCKLMETAYQGFTLEEIEAFRPELEKIFNNINKQKGISS